MGDREKDRKAELKIEQESKRKTKIDIQRG